MDNVNTLLQRAVERIESWKEQSIHIQESISRYRGDHGHDEHFATLSEFYLVVDRVTWSVSGATLRLWGKNQSCYAICTDILESVGEDDGGQLTFAEHFENKTERLTIVNLV